MRSYLLTGELEPTNAPYAISKIAGIIQCQSYNQQHNTRFISAMPTNIYGPHDNFNLKTSHVLPALIQKIITAKHSQSPTVEIWGTGTPKREFLYVDDLADACIHIMHHYNDNPPINVGTGSDISIAELASHIKTIVGYKGDFYFNTEKPDGTPRKLLDISKLRALGWSHNISLEEGISRTVEWCRQTEKHH